MKVQETVKSFATKSSRITCEGAASFGRAAQKAKAEPRPWNLGPGMQPSWKGMLRKAGTFPVRLWPGRRQVGSENNERS